MNETITSKSLNSNTHHPSDTLNTYSIKTKTINTKKYITDNTKNTTLSNFQKYLTKNYTLINKDEIMNFLEIKPLLPDYIKEITNLIKKEFINNKLFLEFTQDPEILEFRYLTIYIKSSDDSFNEDWKALKTVNKQIKQLNLLDNSMKKYILVDLW